MFKRRKFRRIGFQFVQFFVRIHCGYHLQKTIANKSQT